MIRVNLCGVEESEFTNGWCTSCMSKCEMEPSLLIDKRIYDFCKKRRIINDHFSKDRLKAYVTSHPATKFPKYILEYVNSEN